MGTLLNIEPTPTWVEVVVVVVSYVLGWLTRRFTPKKKS